MSSPWYTAIHAHIDDLRADGATWREIAKNTGYSDTLIQSFYNGKAYPTREQALSILAYTVDNRVLEPTTKVSRREADEAIIALLETGYSLDYIIGNSGVDKATVRNTESSTIQHKDALALLDLAEELAYRPVKQTVRSRGRITAPPETLIQGYRDAFKKRYSRLYRRELAKEWGWGNA